jgi:hypothetical protein
MVLQLTTNIHRRDWLPILLSIGYDTYGYLCPRTRLLTLEDMDPTLSTLQRDARGEKEEEQ